MTRRAKDAQAQNARVAVQTNAQPLEAIATTVAELMTRYSFDLGFSALTDWIDQWLVQYPPLWLRSAVIEALYQGRYKAVSVWQILDLWQRRGQPLPHFNREFERMVVGRSFQLLFSAEPADLSSSSSLIEIPSERQHRSAPRPAQTANGQPVEPSSGWQQSDAARLISVPNQRPAPVQLDAPLNLRVASPVIQPFKPAPHPLSLPGHQLVQPRSTASAPVQQFVPVPDRSEFHTKLKSMAAALIRANAHSLTHAISHAVTNVPAAEPTPERQVPPPDPAVFNAASILSSPEAQADQN